MNARTGETMRAVVCRDYGSPETLVVEEVPAPAPDPGAAVVDVRAAAVNFTDLLMLQNRYQLSATPPFVPGSEFAGVVRAVGAGVEAVGPGQRVCGVTFVGAFAERVAVPAASLTVVPDHVDLRGAAAFQVGYGTAYHALRSAARLRAGETLAVLGAAGGVGLAAVELGHVLGARVIAAASGAEKLAACRAQGASDGIDYAREPLKERLKALTGGRGVDVVLDPVGGPLAEQALRATAWRGRFVVVGFASGEIPRIPLNLLLLKGAQLLAFNLGPFMTNEPDEMARNHHELLDLFFADRLHPRIDAVYPLAEAPRAFAHLAERRAIGKVLVVT
jgi:NADPH2:quinone reductase